MPFLRAKAPLFNTGKYASNIQNKWAKVKLKTIFILVSGNVLIFSVVR